MTTTYSASGILHPLVNRKTNDAAGQEAAYTTTTRKTKGERFMTGLLNTRLLSTRLTALILAAGLLTSHAVLADTGDRDRAQQTKHSDAGQADRKDGGHENKKAEPGDDGDDLPTIVLSAPPNNSVSLYPAPFAVEATVTFPGKAEERNKRREGVEVEFLADGVKFAERERVPYRATFTPPKPGTYILTAQIRFGEGRRTLQSAPVTVISEEQQTYYIHTDQLDTPRTLTDTNGNVVWQWDNQDPFGNNVPNENPSNQGNFQYNQRFPGQYFDKETNLHYNVNRDYDPSIGRYVQSDPIGLGGGVNTYTYVNGNPLSYKDPYGLWLLNAVYGGITGGLSGYSGTLAIGGSAGDAAWAALAGAGVGIVTGAVLPDSIPGAMAASGAGAAVGDALGQYLSSVNVNIGEVIGAGIGGSIAGLAPGDGVAVAIVQGELGFMGGTAGAGIGNKLGGNSCH